MGQLHLMRLMSMQRLRRRRRRRREAQAPSSNGLVASRTKRKRRSPCHQDGDSQADEKKRYLGPSLPEDIWHHIHSLTPMRDAARAASVSRTFLRSWRYHPTLTFSNESLGLNKNVCRKDRSAIVFSSKVSHILAMHSGIGLKTLQIHIPPYFSTKDYCHLDSWLQTAVTPGIEELTLTLHPSKAKYDLPYSFLSNGSGGSIRYIHLVGCSFHPAATLGSLRSLTRLHLCLVRITGEVVERLLCNSPALERLEVLSCDGIVCLKVPSVLQRLSYLEVSGCDRLEAIDNKAPNLSSFVFEGGNKVSVGGTLQIKRLTVVLCCPVFYACTKLPSMMPNLEALTLHSDIEKVTPMLRNKFLHLRHLSIVLHGLSFCPTDEYLPLANFLGAAPSLETFHLNVSQLRMKHVSIFDDPSDLKQMQEHQHHNLKNVTIIGFCCAKSLVELTLHVVESTTSLECLTLEAPLRCSDCLNKFGKCLPMDRGFLMEGHRAISAIRTYIKPKVPSSVKLHVLYPCSCHAVQL